MIEIRASDIFTNNNTERRFIIEQVNKIGFYDLGRTIEYAYDYNQRAQMKFDEFKVGTAILTLENEVYGGSNVLHGTDGVLQAIVVAISNARGGGVDKRKGSKFIKCVAVVQDRSMIVNYNLMEPIKNYSDNCVIFFANHENEIMSITSLKTVFP